MKKLVSILLLSVVAFVVIIAGTWVHRTYTLEQPYDEVWIELNRYMPKPVRAWSCGIMKERTRALRAPFSCEDVWN